MYKQNFAFKQYILHLWITKCTEFSVLQIQFLFFVK